MTTLHLMCGLPCSGKTTAAKKLEKELNALRLTPDEWHTRLFGQDLGHDGHDWRHDTIEDLLWNVAAAVAVKRLLGLSVWDALRTSKSDAE